MVWDWLESLGTSVLGCLWLWLSSPGNSGWSVGLPLSQHGWCPLHVTDQADSMGLPRLPRCCRWQLHFLLRNGENTGGCAPGCYFYWPPTANIMSMHDIFTRDNVLGFKAFIFFLDWHTILILFLCFSL